MSLPNFNEGGSIDGRGGREENGSEEGVRRPRAPPGGAKTDGLSRDDIFHILQNRRRRLILRHLAAAGGAADIRDVADWVAAREQGTTVERLESDDRQRVYIALYQSHLPKLDEMGVVRYDQGRGRVERAPLADQIEAYLDPSSPDVTEGTGTTAAASPVDMPSRTPWRWYSLAATLASAVVAGLGWPGLATPVSIPAPVATVVVTGLFAVLTAAMFLEAYRR